MSGGGELPGFWFLVDIVFLQGEVHLALELIHTQGIPRRGEWLSQVFLGLVYIGSNRYCHYYTQQHLLGIRLRRPAASEPQKRDNSAWVAQRKRGSSKLVWSRIPLSARQPRQISLSPLALKLQGAPT